MYWQGVGDVAEWQVLRIDKRVQSSPIEKEERRETNMGVDERFLASNGRKKGGVIEGWDVNEIPLKREKGMNALLKITVHPRGVFVAFFMFQKKREKEEKLKEPKKKSASGLLGKGYGRNGWLLGRGKTGRDQGGTRI